MTTIDRDFTRGPLKRQMLHFSLPLIVTNLLQILFNRLYLVYNIIMKYRTIIIGGQT